MTTTKVNMSGKEKSLEPLKPVEILKQVSVANQSLTPAEVLQHCSLPVAVRLTTQAPLDLGPKVDTEGQFVIHSYRRRTKVLAENLLWDEARKDYVATETPLEIPKDFPGWFEVLPEDGSIVGHHTTVSGVATSGCQKFLVRSKVVGLECAGSQDDELELGKEKKIRAGEVLKVIGPYTKKWKTVCNGQPKATESRLVESRYLRCLDYQKKEVCIPLAHPGCFSVIADRGTKRKNAVYSISHLIHDFDLPVTVRVIFGMMPIEKFPFEGILRLSKIYRPDTFVVQYLKPKSEIFLEIPFDAAMAYNLENKKNGVVSNKLSQKYFYYLVSIKEVDLHYPTKKITEEESGYATVGCMAAPSDMASFHAVKLFPPVREDVPSESWPITFRDPDLEDLEDITLIEDQFGARMFLNKFDGKPRRDSSRSKSSSSGSKEGTNGHTDTVRARREARC